MLGDLHGSIMWAQRTIRAAADAGVQLILQLGDHALLWPGGDSIVKRIGEAAAEAGVEMWCVDANHDPHPKLRALPTDDRGLAVIRDGAWKPTTPDTLFRIPRGHRFDLGGMRFGALGGAHSVDRPHRVEELTWWPEEVVTQAEVDVLGDERLDVLLTHDVAAGVPVVSQLGVEPEVAVEAHLGRELVLQAVARTRSRYVFAGHWHQRLSHDLEHAGGVSQIEVLDCDGAQTLGDAAPTDIVSMEPMMDRRLGSLPDLYAPWPR